MVGWPFMVFLSFFFSFTPLCFSVVLILGLEGESLPSSPEVLAGFHRNVELVLMIHEFMTRRWDGVSELLERL